MDYALAFLTFGTLASVAVLAWINARQTDALRKQGYRSALGGRRGGAAAS
jgi:hypothetical protein